MAVTHDTKVVPILPHSADLSKTIESFYVKKGLQVKFLGIVGVEHCPKENSYDGVCTNVLCELTHNAEKDHFSWVSIGPGLSTSIKEIISKSSFILQKHPYAW